MTPLRRTLRLVSLLALVAAATACSDDGGGDAAGSDRTTSTAAAPPVRLNELQVLGSHNSYHLRPEQAVLDGVSAINPALAAEIDYEHLPLTAQLEDHGIRQLELDVYADPDGGRFAERPALEIVGLPTASGEPALDEPGFKVLTSQTSTSGRPASPWSPAWRRSRRGRPPPPTTCP